MFNMTKEDQSQQTMRNIQQAILGISSSTQVQIDRNDSEEEVKTPSFNEPQIVRNHLETIALGPKPSKSIESLKDSGEYVDVAKSNDKKRIVSQAISKISSMFASDHTKGQQQLSSGKSDIQASYYEKELEDWDCLGSKGISYPLSLYEGPLFKQSMKEIAQPNVGNRAYLIQSK